jgi:PAB-dependent poly(A)-specific ribonuclease subunit 3
MSLVDIIVIQWSETGDRYVLKLFRDYLFHQTMEDGAPVLDAGHVISCLNKLDAGDLQKILLCSRDSKDILVVAFSDIRRLVVVNYSSFPELHQI